jgi:hypothetical protein
MLIQARERLSILVPHNCALHSVMAEKDSSTLAADCRAPGLGPCAPELSDPLPPPTPELLEVPRLLRAGPLRAFFAACTCK